MDINECAERASGLKMSGYNCCQAVTAAIAEMEGISPDELVKIASGFGMGMGNMQATCGALVGAVMMAGVKTGGKSTVRIARQISEAFRKKCGSVTCGDLKGVTGGSMLCSCDQCVRNAVICYGEAFGI